MAPEITEYIPPKESAEEAKALVAKAAGALRSAGVNVTTAIVQGDPKSVILDDAKTWGADLIVLGSHGRKGLERFLVGSVSAGGPASCPLFGGNRATSAQMIPQTLRLKGNRHILAVNS